MEQIDLAILEKVKMVFSSSGNVGHKQGNEIYRNEWVYPKQLLDHLEKILQVHPYPVRTGNHIELRPGMINFSIIGRKCTSEQRREYYLYDQESQERAAICRDIMDNHPNIHASIGGQISVDIYKEGANKPQIIKHIQGPICFFGDRIEPGGNDHDLAVELLKHNHKVIGVKNWMETFEILKKL